MRVKYRIPATTANLGPGFDCLGLALNMYNYVEMEVSEQPGVTISVSGEGSQELHSGQNNLVYRAARTLFEEAGLDLPGLRINQHNDIPLARGLGSSAAALAGGLLAANDLANRPFSLPQLINLGSHLEGHPDNVVPAFLGGFVLSCLQENQVKYVRRPVQANIGIVAAIPDYQLSTQQARAVLPQNVSYQQAVFNISRTAFVSQAFLSGEFECLSWAMEDQLHQNYRASLIPGFSRAVDQAKKSGALATVLSGAGPTLISFTMGNSIAVGQALQNAFANEGITCRIRCVEVCNQGALALS